MSHAYYSLYCKQRELQQPWEAHWACGFASLVTCFRILGDRTTEDSELLQRFRESGRRPRDGMSSDEAVELARSFGYRAFKNPSATNRDRQAFAEWMRSKWKAGLPVMLSVDSGNQQGEADHWWTVYGDLDHSDVWVMEPLDDNQAFECVSISQVLDFASCNDGEGYVEYDGVAISSLPGAGVTGIPPSAALMDFLNANQCYGTGWTSHAIAAALVDNHFSSINSVGSQGKARGAKSVVITDLLEEAGPVAEVIHEWDVFFSEAQTASMTILRAVLYDIEAHHSHAVTASEADHMTREIVLNLILIGTNLMDD